MSAEARPPSGYRYGAIGKYEVLAHVATGGMGAVYKARDPDTGREVALKVLSPELATRPARLERFRREARHGVKLRHENIVALYELGEDKGTHFLVMEFVDGINLEEQIRQQGRLEPAEARDFLLQAARALDHAHRHGVVHRDIKPGNFLLGRHEGRTVVKLIDLGLARVPEDEEFRVTTEGITVGTVDYMSPEQARDSSAADIRSDLYSLGCTFFHMLAGQPPFCEGGMTERLIKHLEAEPPDVRQFNPQISESLVRVLRRLLAKSPGDRYQTPTELLYDLLRAEEAPAKPARQTRKEKHGKKRSRKAQRPKPKPPSSTSILTPIFPNPDADTIKDSAVPGSGSTPEQRQVAAGQFERAQQVLATGNYDYGIQLLMSCCSLEPGNIGYRQLLRRAMKTRWEQQGEGGWRARVYAMTLKSKFRTARKAGDHRKVLLQGEELLERQPGDVPTQMEMADSAEQLGLPGLAVWFLEQARRADPDDLTLCRALADLHERRGDLQRAVAFWQMIQQADPSDVEAPQKVKDLAANETIARGRYTERFDRDATGQ